MRLIHHKFLCYVASILVAFLGLFIIEESYSCGNFSVSSINKRILKQKGAISGINVLHSNAFSSKLNGVFVDLSLYRNIQQSPSIFKNTPNTLHIFSHGRPGQLLIEGRWLNAEQLSNWLKTKNLLERKNTIYIYGCEFAKGDKGKKAVRYLESTLEVSVAASTNITGLGGDWFLEYGHVDQQASLGHLPVTLQCADTSPTGDCDGDGVQNNVDLDNDNDGILNIDEYGCSFTVISDALTTNPVHLGSGATITNKDISSLFGLPANSVTVSATTYFRNNSSAFVRQNGNSDETNYTINSTLPFSIMLQHGRIIGNVGATDGFIVNGGPTFTASHTLNANAIDTSSGTQYSVQRTGGNVATSDPFLQWETDELVTSINFKAFTTDGGAAAYIISLCFPQDTDGDGIQDYLDTESDGDGCFDALEGGDAIDALNVNIDGTLDGTVDAITGVPNNVDVNNGQAVGTAQDNTQFNSNGHCNPCTDGASTDGTPTTTDNDGDGINNNCDLDDDNDGILDTDECSDNFILVHAISTLGLSASSSYTNLSIDFSSNFSLPLGSLIFNTAHLTTNSSGNITVSNSDSFEFEITGTHANILKLQVSHGGSLKDQGEQDGFIALNNVPYNFVSPDPLPVGYQSFKIGNTYYVEAMNNTVTTAGGNMVWQSNSFANKGEFYTTNSDTARSAITVKISMCDTDQDGISNELDLDSDGDGCLDALEANGTLDYSDLNANGSINATVGASTDTNPGVPNNNPATDAGTSQDDTQRAVECDACNSASTLFSDNDGDTIGDVCDLDDDNDGILDTDECSVPQSSEFISISPAMLGITTAETEGNVNATTDISSEFSLPTGSIIVTIENGNTQGSPLGFRAHADYLTKFTVSGSMPVYIRTFHGSALEDNGDQDGFISIDGQSYTPLNAAEQGYQFSNVGSSYFCEVVDETLTDGTQSMNWISDGTATSVQFYTTNVIGYGSAFNLRIAPACDTDNDGIANIHDLDSDNDGCPDVIEAGFTDLDSDGRLGPASITVDANGQVTSGSDGYTSPTDADANGTFDFLEYNDSPTITQQPQPQFACPGCNTTFSTTATGADKYQWQRSNDGGSTWINLINTGMYSGSHTDTLTLTAISPAENNSQYRVLVFLEKLTCSEVVSTNVLLTVEVKSVITNRKITTRVNKN